MQVLPYFKKQEEWLGEGEVGEEHGREGEVGVEESRHTDPVTHAFIR